MNLYFLLSLFFAAIAFGQNPIQLPSFTAGKHCLDTIYSSEASTQSMMGSMNLGGAISDGHFITGMEFRMVVDEINFGQSTTNPASYNGQSINPGDSIALPFDFILASGSIQFHIILIGSPEIEHEEYPCNLTVYYTLGNDYGLYIAPYDEDESSCSVLNSTSYKDAKDEISSWCAPNPCTETTTIWFENPNGYPHEFMLMDIYGKVIYKAQNIRSEVFQLNISEIPSGLYHYKILKNSIAVATKSIVIE